jgi:hypothetical protein
MKPPTPYWICVVRHYFRKGYAQNGLTLPFLIGSRTIVEPGQPLLSIAEFVHQATEHSAGATAMRCDTIGEYVFAELDTESRHYSSNYSRIGQLYFTDQSSGQTQGFAELVDYFTSIYANCLEKQCYSKEAGQWVLFSALDQHHLQELTQKGQE